MKGGVANSTTSIKKLSTKRNEGFYRYLKPGTLARLRDSKISARLQRHDLQTQISLHQLVLSTTPPSSPSSPSENINVNMENQMDHGVPCFALRINDNRPRCLQRKKLMAVTPVFS